ncbi:hypothetical protein COO60DRAFT_627038 [Scenedesmus sp. NREL 46B-D3]|nr:hypothetical protein COO60DRAFT_627038 [Scenedesmus sp. NREL 46B-D3]
MRNHHFILHESCGVCDGALLASPWVLWSWVLGLFWASGMSLVILVRACLDYYVALCICFLGGGVPLGPPTGLGSAFVLLQTTPSLLYRPQGGCAFHRRCCSSSE